MQPNDGRVVSNFIVQALRGADIAVFGDGQQTRAFCYVSDLSDGFVRLMRTPSDVTGPINIGNPAEFTMPELAERVIDLTGAKSSIRHMPLPADDPRQRRPDITLAQDKLGWEPKVPPREGLTRTFAGFEALLANARITAPGK